MIAIWSVIAVGAIVALGLLWQSVRSAAVWVPSWLMCFVLWLGVSAVATIVRDIKVKDRARCNARRNRLGLLKAMRWKRDTVINPREVL